MQSLEVGSECEGLGIHSWEQGVQWERTNEFWHCKWRLSSEECVALAGSCYINSLYISIIGLKLSLLCMQKAQLFKVYGCSSKLLKVIKMVWCKSALNVFFLPSVGGRDGDGIDRNKFLLLLIPNSAKNRGGSCYLPSVESPVTSWDWTTSGLLP